MKKQKIHQAINLLLSTLLVFSIFLTNIGSILVYAQEAHSSVQDEDKTNEVTEINEEAMPFQVETSDEEEEKTQNKFDEISKELNLLLNDEQKNILETILDNDELSSLLQEAIIFHETEAFEEANALYEDIFSQLDTINDKEELEVNDYEKIIKLIEEFNVLAMKKKSLLEYENVEEKVLSSDEKPIEEVEEEVPSHEATIEQEIESNDQTDTSLNEPKMKSPEKEKS